MTKRLFIFAGRPTFWPCTQTGSTRELLALLLSRDANFSTTLAPSRPPAPRRLQEESQYSFWVPFFWLYASFSSTCASAATCVGALCAATEAALLVFKTKQRKYFCSHRGPWLSNWNILITLIADFNVTFIAINVPSFIAIHKSVRGAWLIATRNFKAKSNEGV